MADIQPVTYQGVGALLERLATQGWEPFRETPQGAIIALTRGTEVISLEPGGQFELSGSPFFTAQDAHQENLRHLQEIREAASSVGLRLVALGYRPFGDVQSMPWMPKSRYQVMRDTLGKQGRFSLDMMLMTATGQVSLDWEHEADCARKVTLAARLSPLLVALYANSPLVQGKPVGMMSYRSHVWTDVDAARCGYFPFMLDGTFSYRAYTEWALDIPLLFLRRHGTYLRPAITFRKLLQEGYEGQPARKSDWVDHLSTLFPEVRIKQLMELRAADCVGVSLTGALPALARGIFYSSSAMDEAERLLPKWTWTSHLDFAQVARKEGLAGHFHSTRLADWALDLVAIARRGLQRLDPADVPLLEPLEEQARSGQSPATAVLRAYEEGLSASVWLQRFCL